MKKFFFILALIFHLFFVVFIIAAVTGFGDPPLKESDGIWYWRMFPNTPYTGKKYGGKVSELPFYKKSYVK